MTTTTPHQLPDAVLTVYAADTPAGARVRTLLAELGDIHTDREMAGSMDPHTTGSWMRELAAEERRVWRGINDALTVSSSNPCEETHR